MDRNGVKKAAEVGDIEALADCSQSRDNRLRKAALKALVRLGTSEAADAISAIALTAYDPVVQADATQSLSKLGDLRIVPAERRSRWLRGELDEEPGTAAPHEGSVLPDQSGESLELVAPPPAAAPTDRAHPLMITSGDRQRAGDVVELVLSIPRWPDRKVDAVTLTFWYQRASLFQHEEDARVHTTMTGTAMAHPPLSMGQRTTSVTVATTVVPAAEIPADGRLAARFAIPEIGPPSIPGVITWRAQADVRRQRGMDRNYLADFVVDPAPLSPNQSDGVGDPEDWLLRLCAVGSVPYEDRLAAVGAARHLQLHVTTQVLTPGEQVTGSIAVDLGDGDGRLESPYIALECWRGSELNRTCHRMIDIWQGLDGRSSDARSPREIPFGITLPRLALIHPAACRKCPSVGEMGHFREEERVPPTFHGTDLGNALDDIRWRVVASAFGEPRPANPWWTSAEVIVAPSDH